MGNFLFYSSQNYNIMKSFFPYCLALLIFGSFMATPSYSQIPVTNNTGCDMEVHVVLGTGCSETNTADGTVPPGSWNIGTVTGTIIKITATLSYDACDVKKVAYEECTYATQNGVAVSCCTSWSVSGVGTGAVTIN